METRVQKYSKYRAQMISEGVAEADKTKIPQRNSTGTLPINTVMDSLEDDKSKEYYKEMKRDQYIKIGIIALVALAIIAGVVIFGIYAFNK